VRLCWRRHRSWLLRCQGSWVGLLYVPITTAPSLRLCLSVVFDVFLRSSGCPSRASRTARGGTRSFPRFASSVPAFFCVSARSSWPPLVPAVRMDFSSSERRATHRGVPLHLSSFGLRVLAPAVLPARALSLSLCLCRSHLK
jgi:hypothetical protein